MIRQLLEDAKVVVTNNCNNTRIYTYSISRVTNEGTELTNISKAWPLNIS